MIATVVLSSSESMSRWKKYWLEDSLRPAKLIPNSSLRLFSFQKTSPISILDICYSIQSYHMSSHGGKREGAGRKTSASPYGEPTEVVRVPHSAKPVILDYLEAIKRIRSRGPIANLPTLILPDDQPSTVMLDLYSTRIYAGLPNPAEDHVDQRIDINSFLVEQEDGSFIAQVGSDSLKDIGLVRNHYVVINRKREAAVGNVIAAVVDNEFTLKILSRTKDGRPLLKKANSDPQYRDIEIKEGMQFEVWGVVTGGFVKF